MVELTKPSARLQLALAGDPILRAIAAAEQRRRNAEQLALRDATREGLDQLEAGQSRQVRRAAARKAR